MTKRRVGLRLPLHIDKEVAYFEQKYNVSAAQVILMGFKLHDRKKLEQLLQLSQREVDQA